MDKQRNADLKALLRAVAAEEEPKPPPSAFAEQIGAAIAQAIVAMRSEGVIEVQDENVDALVAQATEVGLDSRSPKQLVKKVIRTLLESDSVDEVYGSDEAIAAALHRFLDPT